jgi:uncharacterized protein YcgI (DUF1989 family)
MTMTQREHCPTAQSPAWLCDATVLGNFIDQHECHFNWLAAIAALIVNTQVNKSQLNGFQFTGMDSTNQNKEKGR